MRAQNIQVRNRFLWVDIVKKSQGKLLLTMCTLYIRFSKIQALKVIKEAQLESLKKVIGN